MIAVESFERLAERSPSGGGLLATVIDALREPVLIVDKTTRIIAANDAARNAFSRGFGAIEGRRLSEVIRDVDLHATVVKSLENGDVGETHLELLGIETRN